MTTKNSVMVKKGSARLKKDLIMVKKGSTRLKKDLAR